MGLRRESPRWKRRIKAAAPCLKNQVLWVERCSLHRLEKRRFESSRQDRQAMARQGGCFLVQPGPGVVVNTTSRNRSMK